MLRRPMYVWYKDSGEVFTISNIKSDEFNNYEIEYEIIEHLMDYRDPDVMSKYNIVHFHNLVNGVPIPEQEVEITTTKLGFYLVPITNGLNNELTLIHDAANRQWKVLCRDDVKDRLDLLKKLMFAVCKKDEPSFLYSKYYIDTVDLKTDCVVLDFSSNIEEEFSKISLIVKGNFNSYGVKENI